MSRTIDERVVSMEFDNKHFEQNVRTSLSTLEKLKQSLNLTGSAKGLESVNAAAKNCNLSPIGAAVDSVKVKFSALEVMAVTTLANITNSAVNAGKRIVSALTIDPVKTGFQEYETQINAVQTILANTKSKGSTLDDVNLALDELNTYADKTIYNFTEMTRNIGTFTAAGVDLDKSVSAIKGIANLAAVSGSTSQQASTAMYQLSQALAAGKVQLMDWNSVVNAGMGGQVFQDALKRTATQMGYNVDQMIKKYGSFRESLTKGEWLTAEVLTETLTQLSGAYSKADLIAQGYTESQAKEIVELAETAVSAATDVKTFTQLLDTLKESAQSGWTQTWELIVGDFEGSKKLWTGVSNVVGDLINNMSDSRNNLLKGALLSNWDKLLAKINEAGISTTDFETKVKEVAKENKINIDGLIKKHGSLEAVFRNEAVSTRILKEAVESLNGSLVDLSGIDKELKMGSKGDDVKKVQKALRELDYDLGKFGEDGVDGIIGKQTEAAIKAFQEAQGLKVTGIIDTDTLTALEKATTKTSDLSESIGSLVKDLDELGGRELLIKSFANIWAGIKSVITPIKTAFRDIFPPVTSEQLYKLIEGFNKLTEKFKLTSKQSFNLKRTFRGLFSAVDIVWEVMKGIGGALVKLIPDFSGLGDKILTVTGRIGTQISKFRTWITSNDRISKGIAKVGSVLRDAGIAIRDWIKEFIELPEVQEKIQGIQTAFSNMFGSVRDFLSGGLTRFTEFIDRIKAMDSISFDNIGTIIKDFYDNVIGYFVNFDASAMFEKMYNGFKGVRTAIGKFLGTIAEKLCFTAEKFEEFKNKIALFFNSVKMNLGEHKGALIAIGTLATIIFTLSKIKKTLSGIANPIEAFTGIGESISGFFDSLKETQKAKVRTAYIEAISKAILMVAGAIFLIGQIPIPTVWNAVGVIAALSVLAMGMLALTRLIDKKIGPGAEKGVIKLGSLMAGLGLSFLLMAGAVKILGGMDPGALKQGGLAVAAFIGMTVLLMKASGKIGTGDVAKFGTMMRKLGTALLIMTASVYILGKMDPDTLIQGGLAVVGFLGIMGGAMVLSRKMTTDVSSFGKMMKSLSVALLLMAGCVYIFGHMETDTLIKGGIAVAAFMGLMMGAMKMTEAAPKGVAKFGKMMLSISAGLILMAAAVKILGEMDPKTLIKGTIAIAAFGGIIVGLMSATKLLGRHSYNAGKMGLMLLSFSASVILITGAIAALSMLDGKDIIKALTAIAGIGAIFAGMLLVTKYAKDIKTGTIIGLSVALAVMAGSLIALSFVDTKKLLAATTALGIIMGMFALLNYSAKLISPKTLVSVAGMILIVGGLGLIVAGLTKYAGDIDGAVEIATAISTLILGLSASCLLLSKIGNAGNAKKAFIGVGVLAAVMGVVGIFAGIAIWQLPNVAKQLSKFMKELNPFISGIKGIDNSLIQNMKTLAEAIGVFAGAGAKFAITDFFTRGGVARAFTEFGTFIKDIVPIVKDIAVEVSGSDVNINYKNLEAIIDATKGLAEAAKNVPTNSGGGVMSAIGGGGFFNISDLSTFITFIKEAVPVIKDMAMEVSTGKVSINVSNLNAIIGAVDSLAQAAEKVPTYDGGVAFGKFKGGWGVAGGVSIPGLQTFVSFVKQIAPVMSNLAFKISKTKIDESDAATLGGMCQAVGYLAEAADKAPSLDLMAGFGKFKGGWGVAGGVSIPGFVEFISFIQTIIPAMTGFTVDISESAITEEDASRLGSMCQAVGYLGEAAGKAPTTDVAAGFAKFAGGLGGGVYFKIPDLVNFIDFIEEVVPIMKDFTVDLSGVEIKESDTDTLISICEAVGILAEAANAAPGKEVAAGLAAVGPAIAGGLYIKDTDLTAFTTWITDVSDAMTGFAVDVADANISEADGNRIKAICEAVKILADAAALAPKDEMYSGVFGTYVSKDNLTKFALWVVGVMAAMKTIAIDISTAMSETEGKIITDEGLSTIQSICNSVKVLADAAAIAPKQTEYEGIFTDWVETTDLSGFTEWIKEVITVLQELGSTLSESDVKIDTGTLQGIAKAAASLGESAYWFTSALNFNMFIDIETAKQYITDLTGLIETFAEDMSSINVEAAASGAGAIKDLTVVLQNLSGFSYSTVDTQSFGTKLVELATNIEQFATDMKDVELSTATAQITALSGLIKTYSETDVSGADKVTTALNDISKLNFSGLEGLGDTLSTIGKESMSEFIKAFTDAGPKLNVSGGSMVSHLIKGIGDKSKTLALTAKAMALTAVNAIKEKLGSFTSAGKSVVQGFADGITANTFIAEAKARAMAKKAYEAAKQALDINSPSKIFRSLGYSVPEGFAVGIDKMGGMVKESAIGMTDTAINGTKKAIARIADAVNSDIDAQPTIRPVVDLSAVTAGANRIDSMLSMSPSMDLLSKAGSISLSMNRRQNGANTEVISAIEDLGRKLGNAGGNTYNVNSITYDDGSNISEAVKSLIQAARVERRI